MSDADTYHEMPFWTATFFITERPLIEWNRRVMVMRFMKTNILIHFLSWPSLVSRCDFLKDRLKNSEITNVYLKILQSKHDMMNN